MIEVIRQIFYDKEMRMVLIFVVCLFVAIFLDAIFNDKE